MSFFNSNYSGKGITNSQVVTEEGKYALDAVQNNPDIEGSLRNELDKKITSGRVYNNFLNKTDVMDEEIVDVPLTLPIGGIFLIEAYVSACHADISPKDSPFFLFQIIKNGQPLLIGKKATTSIKVAKTWDSSNIITFTLEIPSGDITARFISYMGSALDSTYTSTFGIQCTSLQ